MFSLVLGVLGFGISPAHAFCGTYVGQAGSQIYSSVSQVVMVRQGERTTLTLANDLEGDVTDFALVMPVPEVLTAEDVRTVEGELIGALDLYSAPRLVSYECADFEYDYGSDGGTNADTGATSGEDADGSVVVESSFTAGEYEIVVLSATDSLDLVTWLNDNGFAVDTAAEDMLGEYIHDGAYFVAAKVSLEAAVEGRSFLSPLQFGYNSPQLSLPIRLGTLNSQGVQDLLIYAFTDVSAGQVGVSNYDELVVEDDCMWRDSATGVFADFYKAQLDAAFEDGSGAAWVREYSWSPSGCDPCSGEPPTDEAVQQLGFVGGASDAFFTRLHLRYTPEAATADVTLYESNITDYDQIKFIQYVYELEDRFPICGLGFAEDPGTCDDGGTDGTDGADGSGDDGGEEPAPTPDLSGYDKADHLSTPKGCAYGCASGGGAGGLAPFGVVVVASTITLLRRRRS